MKILYIGPSVRNADMTSVPDAILEANGVVRSNFFDSSCFGYEVILVDPVSISVLLNRSGVEGNIDSSINRYGAKIHQWKEELKDWISNGNRVYVFLQPEKQAWSQSFEGSYTVIKNYEFLPTQPNGNIEESSAGSFIGNLATENPAWKEYLSKNKFSVKAYLKKRDSDDIDVISRFDEGRLTSFRLNLGSGSIIFIPRPVEFLKTIQFIKTIESSDIPWSVTQEEEIIVKIQELDEKTKKLLSDRGSLEKQRQTINTQLQKLLYNDIFLSKASKKFQDLKSNKEPDPRDIYDVFETLENAFKNQTEMREKLGLTKKECSNLTRKCNEFRHNQRGNAPKPLLNKETKEFMNILHRAINSYLQYLFDKFP